jgi:hypothetical protein
MWDSLLGFGKAKMCVPLCEWGMGGSRFPFSRCLQPSLPPDSAWNLCAPVPLPQLQGEWPGLVGPCPSKASI